MGKNRGSPLPTMTEDVTGEIFLADNYENGEGNLFRPMDEISSSEMEDAVFNETIQQELLNDIINTTNYSRNDYEFARQITARRVSILRESNGAELMDDEILTLLKVGTHKALMNRQLVDFYRNVVTSHEEALEEGNISLGDGFDGRFEEIENYIEDELNSRGMGNIMGTIL